MQIHYKEVSIMTKYREILRLTALGLKQRDIMKSLGIVSIPACFIPSFRREDTANPVDKIPQFRNWILRIS